MTRRKPILESAIAFSMRCHRGQVDKAGLPYFLHPLAVMVAVARQGMDEDCQIAAVLHDVVEDCHVTISQIEALFGVEVADLVNALTRRKLPNEQLSEPYFAYIERVKFSPKATAIKLADIKDNFRDRDLDVSPEIARLHQRYFKALEILMKDAKQ